MEETVNNVISSNAPTLPPRILWKKCDLDSYQEYIQQHLSKIPIQEDTSSIEASIQTLTLLLNSAAQLSTPQVRPIQRKNKGVWSEVIRDAHSSNRDALHKWQDAGRPTSGSTYTTKLETSKALKSAIHQEEARKRDRFLEEIAQTLTDDQALFHQLIKTNCKSAGPAQIVSNGTIYSTKDELL